MKNNIRRYKLILAISYWLLAMSVNAQVNSDSLITVYSQKMHKYLDKENKASEIFSFTKEGIEMYAPATDTSQKKIELIVHWNDIAYYQNVFEKNDYLKIRQKLRDSTADAEIIMPVTIDSDSSKPLLHYKIALDPGHIAGDLETAKMEKKWVEMKANPLKGIKENVQLIEGELTLNTALILKKKLESEGAVIMLTRDKPNSSSFGIDYKKWKDSLFFKTLDSAYLRDDVSFEEKNFLLKKANETEIFRRFFLEEEKKERVRKINEFHPDLTLIIHYNVDETNQNWNKPTKKDYVMTFVGGGFSADELENPEARIDFLRLLLTDDIEHSIEFSKYIVSSLSERLDIPAALDSCAIYLKDNCISTGVNGVFCRNLTLTRTVKGTLCYGESLYQDNINECKALSKKDASTPLSVTDGIQTSKRVEEVADAYFDGIMNYVKSKKK